MPETKNYKGKPDLKTIIIGEPRSDLAKELAKEPNTDVVSSKTTVTSLLKKYGSDRNLNIYSQGFVYNVEVNGWVKEGIMDGLNKIS